MRFAARLLATITCFLTSFVAHTQMKRVDPEASYPPQQRHFCDVVRSTLAKRAQNNNLNPLQAAQAPPPMDAKEMSRQLMAALGPSLEFSGWRGYFMGVLHGKDVSVEFHTLCYLFGPDGSTQNTRNFNFMSPASRDGWDVYPGTSWLSLSDPLVQKLTPLPNNGGQAIVTGHLFRAKNDPNYVADPTIKIGYGRPLDGGPSLAAFTSVSFLPGK